MQNKRSTHLILVAALVLIAGVMVFTFTNRANAEGDGTDSPTVVTAAVDNSFTYQGFLEDNGSPVTATCDMQFSLWEDGLTGSQVGSTLTKTNVPVADGIFSVYLDFGDQFKGDGRSLHTAVRCPAGSGSYTDILGSVYLAASPYALSLRPGATIAGDLAAPILSVENSHVPVLLDPIGTGGISGKVTGASGAITGVYGESNSLDGYGVYGTNISSTGVHAYGVFGETTSSVGRGVGGKSPAIGIHGTATGGINTPVGVYGVATSPGSSAPASFGVRGTSDSIAGTGVGGFAPLYGVYGESSGVLGIGYGVYGKTDVAGGYGVYSKGAAHVDGKLTWKSITSYVSIAAGAFMPESYNTSSYVDYQNEGHYLKNQTAGEAYYVAPIQLPHGATVTEINFGTRDGSSQDTVLWMRRRSMVDFSLAVDNMAQITSAGSVGTIQEGVWSDSSIENATIDNENYTYYLEIRLPANAEDIKLYGVTIEYTVETPY